MKTMEELTEKTKRVTALWEGADSLLERKSWASQQEWVCSLERQAVGRGPLLIDQLKLKRVSETQTPRHLSRPRGSLA